MKNSKGVFRNLEKMLMDARWFKDGWNIYNRGEYLQLSKDTWYNHNQGGIHFETYIEERERRKKEFPICVHAEQDCPSQEAFIKALIELEGSRIKSWKGYKTIGKGYSICERKMPLNTKNLEQRIFQELSRLRQLEAGIEKALRLVKRSAWLDE